MRLGKFQFILMVAVLLTWSGGKVFGATWESPDTKAKVDKKLEEVEAVIQKGPFKDDWESLKNYKIPDWYQDAKFGIFIHWGLYSVPGHANEWYSRNMYQKDLTWDDAYKYHVATYGPQSKFGYKDFIPLFKADKFDPAHWAQVFKEAGARYVVPVAEHHDGFAMYDSDFSRWTAARMGPHKDLIALEAKAYRDTGLVFGCSSHRAEHWWFMSGGKKFDSDVNDPQYADFYGPAEEDYSTPSEEYLRNWLARSCELVDKYQPRIMYFDWWIGEKPEFAPYLKKFTAYYYDRAAEWGVGVVLNTKDKAFVPGTSVQDVEKGKLPGVNPVAWQTDTSVSWKSWAYLKDDSLKDAGYLIRTLIDAVSRNGNLLLDIGPKPDGTIPEDQERILLEIGDWLKVNGEAIYGTRPWIIFGEGPTQEAGGKFSESDTKYQEGDVRFTRKGNLLYVLSMVPPTKNLAIQLLGTKAAPGVIVKDVALLGFADPVQWKRNEEGLVLSPAAAEGNFPVVYKVTLGGASWGNLSVKANETGFALDALVQNYEAAEKTMEVTLSLGKNKMESKPILVDAQASTRIDFSPKVAKAGLYKVTLSSPGQAPLSAQGVLPAIDLTGMWLFKSGDEDSWSAPRLDEKTWQTLNIPSKWEDQGNKCENCYGWYRRHFTIPAEWQGHSIVLPLGKIDDVDAAYLNGKKIGGMGTFPPDMKTAWDQVRHYEVPAKLIHFGKDNVIAIRVYNGSGGAGLYEGPLGPIEVK